MNSSVVAKLENILLLVLSIRQDNIPKKSIRQDKIS
jgi:hypothetical protein